MKTKIICSIMIIVLVLSCVRIQSFAVTQSDIQNQQNTQDELNSQISDTKDQVEEVQEQLSAASQEVQELVSQIGDYEDSISNLNSQISEKETEISNKEQEIIDTQKDMDEKQNLLNERLVSLYMSGQTSYIELLLSSADLTDFISKYYLISELATYDADLIQSIRNAKAALETAKTELETAKSTLEASKAELVSTQASLKSAKAEKDAKVANLTSEEKELASQLEELQEQENKVSSQIKKMKAEYEAQLAAAKNNSSSGNSSSSGGSSSNNATSSYGFGWPVSNPIITTGYGSSGKYWSSGKHTGIDFRASTGTPVYSIGDGIVVDTGHHSSYGNYVEIYHGNNIYSYYAHNSSVIVSTGQKVSKGQQISYSGATGNVTGPHLHFEIRTPGARYANCVNPVPYLP